MTYADLKDHLRGVAFTIPTPFSEDGMEVHYEELRRNVDALVEAGAKTFVPCGNTGEYYSLTTEERVGVVKATADAVGDEGVVVGGASGSTKSAQNLIEEYERAGADGVMLMHPHHTFMHERGLKRHFQRLVDATDLGILIYKKGAEITDDTLSDLAAAENVVGVKYAVNDIKAFSKAVHATPNDIVWLNGQAERFEPAFTAEGASGFSTGCGNFAPEASLALMDALRAGDWERAYQIREVFRPLEDLRDEGGPDSDIEAANNVSVVKAGMELAGLYGGPVREPIVNITESDRERVREHYDELKQVYA